MEYNKTKRGLEKAAGIVGVIVSSIEILTFLIIMILCLKVDSYNPYNAPLPGIAGPLALILIIPIGICVANLILGAKVIKSPVQEDGSVKPRSGIRICFIVFSFLDAQWVTFGLMIAVICLKDFPQRTFGQAIHDVTKSTIAGTKDAFGIKSEMEKQFEQIAELKKWKDLGLLNEEEYNIKRKQILGL